VRPPPTPPVSDPDPPAPAGGSTGPASPPDPPQPAGPGAAPSPAGGARSAGGGSPLPNRRPTARNDATATTLGPPVAVEVTANDSDPDDDPLAVKEVRQPPHGAVVCAPLDPRAFRKRWACTYAPAPGFAGPDTFAYTLADPSGETSAAFVTVRVGGGPPPVTAPTPSRTP